jgi:hypothetical protein
MNTEKQYIQAFNNGYILAQYEPNFSNILIANLTPTNNYLQGFFAGKKQLEFENSRDQLSVSLKTRKRVLVEICRILKYS